MNLSMHSIPIVPAVAFSLGVAAIGTAAAQTHAAGPHHTVVSAEAVKWGPAPPSLPRRQ